MVLKIFICPSHIANCSLGLLESMGHDRHPIRALGSFHYQKYLHRNLATVGLGMEHKTVDKHLKNKDKEIYEAVLGVLKEWLRGQDNPKAAYRKLCEALRHKDVNMRSFIVETLQ